MSYKYTLAFKPLDLFKRVDTQTTAECMAHTVRPLDGEGLLRWDETFLDGSFAPAKKGAQPSVKPSVARARSGWYWSTVKVFRWEFGSKVPLRENLHLRKPRSPKSACRAERTAETEARAHNCRPERP
jgi:hypothetical protein